MSMMINSSWFTPSQFQATVTVPSGKVSADLTAFPLMIDLSLMPIGFWGLVTSTGGNIRAYASDGVTQLPFDVTYINKTRGLGRMFVKTNLLTASNNVVIIKVFLTGASALPVTDTYGRNAVWADYEVVIVYPETVNRTGDVYTRTANEVQFSEWKRVDYYDMTGNPHQGVAVDTSGNLVTIDTNYLRRSTQSAPNTVLASNADPVGAVKTATGNTSLSHMSDGCIIAGELWVPCNEYPVVSGNDEYLCVFNLSTLALDRTYNVSSVGRHIAGICYVAATSTIYAVDYLSGASMVRFDTSGSYLGTTALSVTLSGLQGIEYVEGDLILSQESVDLARVSLAGSVYGSAGDEFSNPQGGISEGISYNPTTKKLFHMDGDGDMTVLEKVAGIADWGRLHLNHHAETYPRSTVWSMGVSVYWLDLTGDTQQGFVSMANGNTSGNRSTLAFRTSSNRVSLWNSTDGWLESDVDANYKDTLRLTAKHDGTTQRKLFVNGILKATDNTISARPTGPGTDMDFVINASDTSNNEDGEGYYQFAWARNDYVSDAWMAADAEVMNSPGTFYTIT